MDLPQKPIQVIWLAILILAGGLIILADEVHSLGVSAGATSAKLDYIHEDIRELRSDLHDFVNKP